jgi:histidinol-phosphatase (PHP family)
MPQVAKLLTGYPFDVLLGSVHWIGAWMFDDLSNEVGLAEWDHRDIEEVWRAYTEALEELAGTKTCDVLAHPDLVKITGRRASPSLVADCNERISEAAAASGMAAEFSSAGWRRPVAEAYPSFDLLERFRAHDVSITTASDAHGVPDVADRADELLAIAQKAGYKTLRSFRARQGRDVPITSRTGRLDVSMGETST